MAKKLKQIPERMGRYYVPTVLVTLSVCLFLLIYTSVQQKEIVYTEGQLSEETIRANKTVENKKETEEKQRLAMESVVPEYTYNTEAEKKQLEYVETIFQLVKQVNADANKQYLEDKKQSDTKDISEPTVEDKLPLLKSTFERYSQTDVAFYQSFPDSFYEKLLSLNDEELDALKQTAISKVEEVMSKRIRNATLVTERQNAKNSIQYTEFNATMRLILSVIYEKAIVVNEVANEKATEELKQAAKNKVLPVMIYQGEIIVREGEQIDAKALEKIQLLGLDNQSTSRAPMFSMILAIGLQVLLLMYLLRKETLTTQIRSITLYAITLIILVGFMKLLYVFQKNSLTNVSFLFPAAFGPVMLYLFIDKYWGFLIGMFQALFSIFIFYSLAGTTSLLAISMFYIFCAFVASMLSDAKLTQQIRHAFVLLIILPVIFMSVLLIYQGFSITDSRTIMTLLISTGSGILSFILVLGLYPYIELILTDDSVIVLNDLSNPNHPLLKKLLEEAPGTYHHSMMVANLSANAVAEIGGNSLLTRVACYYHDIGKIKHANFFVENLPDGAENPHNFLLPSDSKEIIFGHVTEGVKILEEANMPKFVIDVCRQHHGTTLMKFFYFKEKERNSETVESDFQYPGPKPQSKEAAVINLADSSEAAVRAMDHPNNEKIQKFVHQLIQSRIEDGELNESNLTLNELNIIEKSLVNGLCSTFHSRIKYPKMKSEAEKMKNEQDLKGV